MKKNNFKKTVKYFSLILLIFFSFWYYINASKISCYHYVENLVVDGCVNELDKYVSYSMLSSEIKKSIKKEDLKFTTDEELFSLAQKLQEIDYGEIKNSKFSYSTSSFGHSDDLYKKIFVNGKCYDLYISMTFVPNYFSSKPKIIRFEAYMREKTTF